MVDDKRNLYLATILKKCLMQHHPVNKSEYKLINAKATSLIQRFLLANYATI